MNYEQFKLNQGSDIVGKTGLFAVTTRQMYFKHNMYKQGKLPLEKILNVDYFNKIFKFEANDKVHYSHPSRRGMYFMEIVENNEQEMLTNEEIKENVMNNLRIFRTTDYSIFKFNESNRDINKLNLKKIKESIQKIGFQSNKRILVNENMEIVDGQHRFVACKELGLPIEYEIVDECENLYINLNIGSKPLSAIDYVKYYSAKGFNVYITIHKLYEQYKNKYSITDVACSVSGYHGQSKHGKLSDGTLPQLFDYAIAEESLYYYTKIKSIPSFRNWYMLRNFVQFLICLCVLKRCGVDLQKLYSNIEKNIVWLLKNPILKVDDLYNKLERIYYKNVKNATQLNFRVLQSQFKNENMRKGKENSHLI